MRLLLILLCSCAPVVTAIPSSLPYVRVDPELQGAVISRDAAIVVATKRIEDKARCASSMADCTARATSAEQALAEQTKRADNNAWLATYWPGFLVVTAVVFAGSGLAAGFAIWR